MSEKILIVAQTENHVIGKDNTIPWHLPRDLRHFKETTISHHIIMGHRTYTSVAKALPGRVNHVISRDPGLHLPDATVHATPEAALCACESAEKVFLIGGATIYRVLIDKVDALMVTWIHTTLDGDTYFPAIDPTVWRECARTFFAKDAKNLYDMSFVKYTRNKR